MNRHIQILLAMLGCVVVFQGALIVLLLRHQGVI